MSIRVNHPVFRFLVFQTLNFAVLFLTQTDDVPRGGSREVTLTALKHLEALKDLEALTDLKASEKGTKARAEVRTEVQRSI